jgi:uncharacterized protein
MNPFYIYALKDPRTSPAKPFYIGKGTGVRAWEHTLNVDNTRKGKLIAEIVSHGQDVLTTILADDLTESQALKLEAELISAFGTIDTGGLLANSVIPTGARSTKKSVIIPEGAIEKAQIGLTLLKDSIYELASANQDGIINAEAAKILGLQSSYSGGSKDYLTWSILGLLLREGKLVRDDKRRHKSTKL